MEAALTGTALTITCPLLAGITRKALPMCPCFMGCTGSACSPAPGQAPGLGCARLCDSAERTSKMPGNFSATELC